MKLLFIRDRTFLINTNNDFKVFSVFQVCTVYSRLRISYRHESVLMPALSLSVVTGCHASRGSFPRDKLFTFPPCEDSTPQNNGQQQHTLGKMNMIPAELTNYLSYLELLSSPPVRSDAGDILKPRRWIVIL